MHREQYEFVSKVKKLHPYYFTGSKVLEVGSLNINGTVRSLFTECNYTGIDVGPGADVDEVCLGHEYKAPDSTFDVVISCETFEHDPHWKDTFHNMLRLCKPGGIVIATCATTGRKEHGTPNSEPYSSPNTVQLGWNYYKNLTEENFLKEFELDKYFYFHIFEENKKSFDLYFYGIRRITKE